MENLNKFMNLQNLGETNIINSKKKGSFLEWVIKRVFQTIGFYATNKNIIKNNQIDVFVNYNDIKILVQCKQYEKGTPAVKDLIYEWNSKRIELECEKALLILWGYPKIEREELRLSKKWKVYLWNDTLIAYFFDLILSDVNKAKNEILLNLEIDNEEAQRLIISIKENLERGFKYSLENKKLLTFLNKEILDCFKDGTLIKQNKFETIWKFLINKKLCIMARPSKDNMLDRDTKYMRITIKSKDDFDIVPFDVSSHWIISIDGCTIMEENVFNNE